MSIDLPTELLTASSGSVGDVVASRNQHAPYLRPRTVPTDPATALQVIVRNHLTTCVLAWNDTLTQSDRNTWERYALAVQIYGRLGRRNRISGIAMYIRCNVPRLQADEPTLTRIDVAPDLQDLGSYTPLERIVLNFNDDTIHPVFTESDAWVGDTGAAMLLYASAAKPLTRTFWRGPYRYAGPLIGGDPQLSSPGTIPLPAGASVDQRVFVQGRVTQADGRLSHTFRLPADAASQAAPVPISALFIPGPPRPRIAITYDQPIARQSPTGTNWTARFNDTQLGFQSRSIANELVTITWTVLGVMPGPDVVNYSAATPDHRGLFNGVDVAAYANFPVV